MISLTADNLATEIRAAEAVRKRSLEAVERVRHEFAGRHYQTGAKASMLDRSLFEYAALHAARLVYANPTAEVRSRRSHASDHAQAVKAALNRWIADVALKDLLTEAAFDTLFGWSVVLVSMEPIPGGSAGQDQWCPYRPCCTLLKPHEYLADPVARIDRQARWSAHLCVEDLDDLVQRAKTENQAAGTEEAGRWDLEALGRLAKDAARERLDRDPAASQLSRGEIVYYEMWVPEAGPAAGLDRPDGLHHGALITVAVEEQGGVILRAPRPFFGPRQGPYTVLGIYPAHGPYPLSPMVATLDPALEFDRESQAMHRGLQRRKRMAVVDSSNPELAAALQSAEDGSVRTVPNFNAQSYAEIEVGGLSREQIEGYRLMQDRLDRATGQSDTERGNIQGVTASEIAAATMASQTRNDFVGDRFQSGVERLLHAVAWYLFHDDRVVFPLAPPETPAPGSPAPATGMAPGMASAMPPAALGGPHSSFGTRNSDFGSPSEAMYFGGLQDDESPSDFEDLELVIEAGSMQRTSEAVKARRVQTAVETIVQTAPLVPRTPWIDWQRLYGALGDAMNMPDWESIVRPELALAAAAPPAPGTPGAAAAGPGGNAAPAIAQDEPSPALSRAVLQQLDQSQEIAP